MGKSLDFFHAHTHSEFSRLDSAIQISQMAEAASRFRGVALTDHGNVDGALRYQQACEAAGAPFALGCELYVCEDRPKDRKRHHLTVIAKSRNGFASICRALSYANLSNMRGGVGMVPWEKVLALEEVVVTSGCLSSPVWKIDVRYGEELAERFGEDFYIETQPLDDLEDQIGLNRKAARLAKRTKAKLIATCDCHFCDKGDALLQEVVLAVGQKPFKAWDDPDRWRFDSKLNYFMGPKEIRRRLVRAGLTAKHSRRAVTNTLEVAEKTTGWRLESMPISLPGREGAEERLVKRARKGLERMGKADDPAYAKRLEKELTVFTKAGIAAYLLLFSKIVRWAKRAGIMVGPGRGSAVGSLVVRALGITSIDPIKYELPYQRFYAPGRKDMPDIDVDFADYSRPAIERYLGETFGEDRVAHVSAYSTVKAKAALRDIARVFGVTERVDALCKAVMSRDEDGKMIDTLDDLFTQTKEGKRFARKHPQIAELSRKYEGRVRQVGQHAGGFVVGEDPLDNGENCVLYRQKNKIVVNWNKDDLEHFGLLKLDLLGLSTLSVLDETSRIVGGIDYEALEPDDPKVYKEIRKGNTVGAFQIQTYGLRTLCREMKVKDFNDLFLASAVFRPGALEQGIAAKLAKVCRGERIPPRVHPKLRKLLRETYNYVIYQEQVMRLAVRMAGWTWTEADGLRKVIGKSKGREAMESYREKFVDGCLAKGTLDEKAASALWKKLISFGRYGFGKSHSVAYSMLTYRTMWAKVHHPAAFHCALLKHLGRGGAASDEKQETYLDEIESLGIEIREPDVNFSRELPSVEDGDAIRLGLQDIDEIGEARAEEIVRARGAGRFRNFDEFIRRVEKRVVNKSAVENLKRLGAMSSLGIEGLGSRKIQPGQVRRTDQDALSDLRKQNLACEQCDLRDGCRKPVPVSKGRTNVMIVGEAPGATEDARGIPFVGEAGQILRKELKRAGLDPKDLHFTNTISCRPENNVFPGVEYIKGCPWLDRTIEAVKPVALLVLGNKARYKFTGEQTGIQRVGGTRKFIAEAGAQVVFGVHPASILYRDEMRTDLRKAVKRFAQVIGRMS